MSERTLKLWGKGQFKIMDFETTAYILEDGTALISRTKMFEAIGMKKRGGSRSVNPSFVGAVNLQSFIKPELQKQLEGIQFYDGGMLRTAYPAEILPSICEVYLDARRAGVLTPNQERIAEVCEILLISFSKVGIRALIYEQLGFEKFKHPEAFRMLIEGYLADEIRKWSKEFPDALFMQMDRIYGNERTTSRNRPQYYAGFIRKYIYDPIESGVVLKKLDEKIPKDDKGRKKKRLHSAASVDIGLPAIKAQIFQVLGVLKSSANKRTFESNYNRMMGNAYQTALWGEE
jgi:hypothetical protein